ncbi:hypothetical protein Vretimale_16763 [Volvox reticuliferus]|uniref:AP2/ERF domain-containing protein n=1 Tax=Volvox reticuliferus TaxID=1737510 RepID=A0A8J4LXQ1_9CHLO|nr:hypothetical protein Vretimale_16763 [Volvox reticuliferus]
MTDAAHGSCGGGAGGGGNEAVGPASLSGEVMAMQTGAALGSAHPRLPAANGSDIADVASSGGGAGMGSLQPFHSGGLQDIPQASATAGGQGGGSSSILQHLLGPSSLSGPGASPFGSQPQQSAGPLTGGGLQQLAPGTSAPQQPSHAQQQSQQQQQQQSQQQPQQQSLAVTPNVLAMLAALTASQPVAAGANQGGAGGAAAGGTAGGLQIPRPAPLGLTALATLAAKQQAGANAAGGGGAAPGGAGGAARAGSGGGAAGNGGGNGGAAGAATATQLNPINLQAALQAAAASALMAAQRSAVAAAVQHAQGGLDGHAVGAGSGGGDARKRKRSSPSPPAGGTAAAVARMVASGTHHLGSGGAILGGLGDGAEADRDSPCRNQTGYVGVRMRKWGMFAAEIRDGDKRRWLGSFGTAHEAGLAYDAAAIVQKGTKAKTNFSYMDYETNPRAGAETMPHVRWDLLPEEVAQQMAARAVPNKGGRLGIGTPAASRPRGASKGPPAAAAASGGGGGGSGPQPRIPSAGGSHAGWTYTDPLLPPPKRTSIGGGPRYAPPAVTGMPHGHITRASAGAAGSAGSGRALQTHTHPHGAVGAAAAAAGAYPPYGGAATGNPTPSGPSAAAAAAVVPPASQADGVGGLDPAEGPGDGPEPNGRGVGHAHMMPPGYDPRVIPGAYPPDMMDAIDPYGPPPYSAPYNHGHSGGMLPPGHSGHYYTDPNGDAYYYDVPPYYVEEEEEELAAAAAAGHPYAMSYYGVPPPHPHMPPHIYHPNHGVMAPPTRLPYSRSGGSGGSSGGGGAGAGVLRAPHHHAGQSAGLPAEYADEAVDPGPLPPDIRMRSLPSHPSHGHPHAYTGRGAATGASGGAAAVAAGAHPTSVSNDPQGPHGSISHHPSYPPYAQAHQTAAEVYPPGRRHGPSGGGGGAATAGASTAAGTSAALHHAHVSGGAPPQGFGAGAGGGGGGGGGHHNSHAQHSHNQGHLGHSQAHHQQQQHQQQHGGGGGGAGGGAGPLHPPGGAPQGAMAPIHPSHHPHHTQHAAPQQQQQQQQQQQHHQHQHQQHHPGQMHHHHHHGAQGQEGGGAGAGSDQTELYYQKFHELTQAIKKVAGESGMPDGASGSGGGSANGAGLDDVIRNLSFFTGRR